MTTQTQSQPATQPTTGGGIRRVVASDYIPEKIVMDGKEFLKLNGGQRQQFFADGGIVENQIFTTRRNYTV